jgi:glutaredoxin
MKTIVVFTLNGCIRCSELKAKLKEQNIAFHDIEITKNSKLWNGVVAQTGHDVLPTVFIPEDGEGNGLVYNPGRDFQTVDEIIEIIKNNI